MRNLSKKITGIFTLAAIAVTSVFGGFAESSMSVSKADEIPVIEIRTAADLRAITGKAGVIYKLMNDIDLSDTAPGGVHAAEGGWVPLDNFNATLDGNGFSITNLNIYAYEDADGNEEYNMALFRSVDMDAVVKNLSISVNINKASEDTDKMGAICGYNDGTIENCHVSGTISCVLTDDQLANADIDFSDESSISASERVRIGGVCARNEGTVSNCYSNVMINTNNPFAYAAGICAGNVSGTISNCYNAGTVTSTVPAYAKNVYVAKDDYSEVTNCYGINTNLDAGTVTDGVTLLSDADMKVQSNFAGFDFANVWEMGTITYFYPVLKGLYDSQKYTNPAVASGAAVVTAAPDNSGSATAVTPVTTPTPVVAATPAPAATTVAQPAIPIVGSVTGITLVSPKKKRFRVTYLPVTVSGYDVHYEVQYSPKKNMKNTKTKDVTKTKVVVKKLKKKKYFVRVRAYVLYSGIQVYSPWSTTLKIKLK